MRAMMYGLVELRDKGELQLSPGVIREYITLEKNFELLQADISEMAKTSLKAFLSSVGYVDGKPLDKQPRSLNEQHGYARSYFGLALNNMTDTYSHIYGSSMGEVDMYDVVQNRRILVTLLPALALAPEELKNLGVISLSSIKNAISIGLGSGQEGTFEDVLYSLPTDAPAPFLSVTDEYAAIPTPGYVEVLTQGRGLGIAAILASQDYAGISKADAEGAQQIVENSKYKFALKMESAGETWELFNKLSGDVMVMESGGSAINKESFAPINYNDDMTARATERARINLRDLQEQIEGEFHAFFNGDVVRGSVFYANPPLPKDGQIRINQMVQVFLPDPKEIDLKFGSLKELTDRLIEKGETIAQHKTDIERSELETTDQIEAIASVFNSPGQYNPMEQAIIAFMQWIDVIDKDVEEMENSIPVSPDTFSHESIDGGLDEESTDNVSEEDFDQAIADLERSARANKSMENDIPGIEDGLENQAKNLVMNSAKLRDVNGASEKEKVLTPAETLKQSSQWMGADIIDSEFEQDMTRLNVKAGISEDQAKIKATKLADSIQKDMRYPKPPKPSKDSSVNKEELTTAVSTLLDNIKKRSK
nr:TraM recognition domain-containing protein [Methylomarinum sp. Ch1-1]MDP4523153.1 TraM recognition domain-containing protein [Methylomarinum sp. Ch1-1]